MEIRLDLSKHCIETEIRRIYNRTLSKYFKPDGDKATLERIIDATGKSLATFDFPGLRSRYPELAGGTAAEVVLSLVENGRLTIAINGGRVAPILRTEETASTD